MSVEEQADRYIEKLEQKLSQLQQEKEELVSFIHKKLGFLENCVGGNSTEIDGRIIAYNMVLEILEKKGSD